MPILSTASRPLALAGLLGLAFAAPAHADGVAPGDTLLTIPAEGKISAAPDMATVSAGVVTTGASAAAAMADNAAAMARTFAALQAAGVAERDIQTSSLNLSPQFAPNPDNAPPRITGYRASNTVTVQLREIAKVGAAVDALVKAGANEINGPDFALSAPDATVDAARVQAIATARARAALYAQAAGLHVARILSITEDGGEVARPMPMVFMAVRKEATRVAAGSLDMTAHVTVTFELAP